MSESGSGRYRWLAWVGALLCLLAVAAATVGVISIVRAVDAPKVRLGDSSASVVLPPDRTYGIFINDADNSGYSESCTVNDRGRQVELKNPPFSMSSSDTEDLDFVFNTGSGHLTIACHVPGEGITAKAVPSYVLIVASFLFAAALGCVGFGMLVGWVLVRRPSRSVESPGFEAPASAVAPQPPQR